MELCLSWFCIVILLTSILFWQTILECQCNQDGSASMNCDANGDCICKEGYTGKKCDACMPNVIGDKCDTCLEHFFNYPTCEGLFNQLFRIQMVKGSQYSYRLQM